MAVPGSLDARGNSGNNVSRFGDKSFLDSLQPAERQAFISVAEERTFQRDALIMRQGGPADRVIVILAGWTRITVRKNGTVLVIAERGPGQLIGERSALRRNVRSADVTALGTVEALVMRTEDFASFIDAHPRVLDVVERQIYDRLTEDRARPERPGRVPAEPAAEALPAARPAPSLSGENCTVLLTDVVGFGARNRNDHDRRIVRLRGRDMIRTALGEFWDECIAEDRGDGLLIVVPPHVPTAWVVSELHQKLPDELRRHNHTYSEPVRIKLRIAANVGPVMSDDIGMSGEAIIRTSRLVECPAIKKAMTESGAALGIIVSDFVYETAVRHSAPWVGTGEYRQVRVKVKEQNGHGWLRLFHLSQPGHRDWTEAGQDGPAPAPA